MEATLLMSPSDVPRAHGLVTSSPAVPGGWRPLPVPRSLGTGPGAPPATAGEVTQTFRQPC